MPGTAVLSTKWTCHTSDPGAADGSAHGRFLNIYMEEIKKEPEIGGFSGTLAQVDGLIRCMDGVNFVTADRFQEHVHTEGRRQLAIRGEAVRHAGQAVLIVAVPAPDETDVRHGPKHGALFQMVLRALEQFGQPSGIIQIQAVGHEIALRGKHASPQSVAIQRCFGGAGIRALRIGEKHIDAVIAEPGEEELALQIARNMIRGGRRRVAATEILIFITTSQCRSGQDDFHGSGLVAGGKNGLFRLFQRIGSGNQGRQIKPPRFHEAGGKREFLIGAQRAADRDFLANDHRIDRIGNLLFTEEPDMHDRPAGRGAPQARSPGTHGTGRSKTSQLSRDRPAWDRWP